MATSDIDIYIIKFALIKGFARNLLREEIAKEILFVFRFNVWPGTRTLALPLISQHTTY